MKCLKVSFVILTWKRANMLKICVPKLIESIQNKNDCEIIIFDNASNDDTEALLKDLVSEFSSQIDIKYYISDKIYVYLLIKKLFKMATGDIVIEVDDDVLAYPTAVDQVFIKYFENFKNFGFLALDVIQNEHTNGSKPESHHYTDVTVNGLTVESGPTGGWCAGFRAKDFRKFLVV
jgi:glycosyltransferase involved in cell wall biosynthesis